MDNRIKILIAIQQAGFRNVRNCCDQVLSRTSHIVTGFQDKNK